MHAALFERDPNFTLVKLALHHVGPAERLVLSGKIDRIGLTGSRFEMKDADGKCLEQARTEPARPRNCFAVHALCG